jgi:ABC-type transport system involved in cytochrome bd biosynthesis fused ATPase/permease subunit
MKHSDTRVWNLRRRPSLLPFIIPTLLILLPVVRPFTPACDGQHRSSFPQNSCKTTTLLSAVTTATTSTSSPTKAEAPAIVIDQLTCTHDGGDTYQLQDVSYNLPRNGKIALLGRNGAGKSTFLRILAETTCFDRYNVVNTVDMGMKYTGKITAPRTMRVAYVEQEPPLYTDVTVADALLGIRGTIDESSDVTSNSNSNNNNSNNNDPKSKSVYATVRRYRLAAENVASDRT